MPRLGDLLVQAGRVTPDEVDEAARSQVAYGGRIGTNLVELSHIEIDELTQFLGRQHHLPAAQRQHFDQADRALQALLPAEIASRYKVVPIARVAGVSRKIALASLGPLSGVALTEVARALGCDAGDLVVAVAAELRLIYNLERVYSIARPSRFLRTRRGGTSEFAIAPLPPGEGPGELSEDDLAVPGAVDEGVTEPIAEDEIALEIEADYAAEGSGSAPGVEPEPGTDPALAERRRFVRTLADSDPPATHPAPPRVIEPAAAGSAAEPAAGITSLGRIALRKLSAEALAASRTASDGLRAIRRCRDRDQIGNLAIDLLDRGSGAAVDAGVLFIARGMVAVGWKGFARGAEVAFDQLAVPLDQPSVLARGPGAAIRRLTADSGAAEPLDARLVAALGFETPTFIIVAPIAINDRVIAFVYAHGRGAIDAVEPLVVETAEACRTALTSLLRAAQR